LYKKIWRKIVYLVVLVGALTAMTGGCWGSGQGILFCLYNPQNTGNTDIYLPSFGSICYAESQDKQDCMDKLQENFDKNLADIDMSELQKWLDNLDKKQQFPTNIKESISKLSKGEFEVSFGGFLEMICSIFLSSFMDILPTIVTIIAIAVLYSLLNNLTSGFLSSPTKQLIYFVCYIAIIVVVMSRGVVLVGQTSSLVIKMKEFMEIVFPILLTTIALLGGVSTSAVFKPMMGALATSITMIVVNYVLPLVVTILIFSMISNLSRGVKLEKLTSFFTSLAKVVMGTMFSIFITFLSFQGLTSGVVDTISIKTAKFALQSYVPIVGGYLSDGFDLMMASIVLIKNSVGVISIMILMTYVAVPVVNIIMFSLGLKLAAGIIEPISDSSLAKVVSSIGKNINMLVAIILGVLFMFLMTIVLIIYACNLGVV